MNIFRITLVLVLGACLSWSTTTVSTQRVTGNATDSINTFDQAVNALQLDPYNGHIYVGLGISGGNSSNNFPTSNYAVAKASPVTGNDTPSFSGIGSHTLFSSLGILDMALLAGEGTATPTLILTTSLNDGSSEPTTVHVMTTDGSTTVTNSVALVDAAGSNATTNGIVRITANSSHFFAAIRDSSGGFLGANGGIAVGEISDSTLVPTIKDASAGGTGNKAQGLSTNTPELLVNNALSSLDALSTETICMHWDETVQRLYIGVCITTAAGANNGGRAVVVTKVGSDGTLTYYPITPTAALSSSVHTNIVADSNSSSTQITVNHLRTMHTSTGFSYLVVQGGNGARHDRGNNVYALPLVDINSTSTVQGTLASTNATNFNLAASHAGANNSLYTMNSTQAQVGGGSLPIQAAKTITDMQVIGDTVYVSTDAAVDTNNDAGIFYSQALFDHYGRIVRWTTWAKRLIPYDAFSTLSSNNGKIGRFALDARNGRTWAFDGNKRAAVTTVWKSGSSGSALPTKLNTSLTEGCFCVLDMHQNAKGFGTQTTARYALFGGLAKVIFAKVSTGRAVGPLKPETLTTDFSVATNYLSTELPSGAGAVRTLAFSNNATNGYFIAGTDAGLYVYSNAGADLTASALGDLNASPFTGGTWTKVSGVTGAVTRIRSNGNGWYVLARDIATNGIINDKFYFVGNAPTTAALSPTLLATSGTSAPNSDLTSASLIFDFALVPASNTAEHIILATSNGLYTSATSGGVQGATSQATALWAIVSGTSGTAYQQVEEADDELPSVSWPVEFADSSDSRYDRSTIKQLCAASDAGTVSFVPTKFNAKQSNPTHKTLLPVTAFWTDGGRRFMPALTSNDIGTSNTLLSIPFDTLKWHITDPVAQFSDPVLVAAKRIYWIAQIGATGIVLAGTESGVISLE